MDRPFRRMADEQWDSSLVQAKENPIDRKEDELETQFLFN